MVKTRWMVYGRLLYSFLSCAHEIRIKITLKQTDKKQEKAAAGPI